MLLPDWGDGSGSADDCSSIVPDACIGAGDDGGSNDGADDGSGANAGGRALDIG